MTIRKTRKTTNKLSRSQKLALFIRDDFTCAWCNQKCPEESLSADHIIPCSIIRYYIVEYPLQRDRPKVQECITACKKCNRLRSNMSIWKFAYLIERASKKYNHYSLALKEIARLNKEKKSVDIVAHIIKQINKPVYPVRSIKRMILDYKEKNERQIHGQTH